MIIRLKPDILPTTLAEVIGESELFETVLSNITDACVSSIARCREGY